MFVQNKKLIGVLLFGLLLIFPSLIFAEEEKKFELPFDISLGEIFSEAESAAVRYAIKTTKGLVATRKYNSGVTCDNVTTGKAIVPRSEKSNTLDFLGNSYALGYEPQVDIISGEKGTFSSITAKISGINMFFDATCSGGTTETLPSGRTRVVIPYVVDQKTWINAFPISAGFEADRKLDTVNGLMEIGWTPLTNTNLPILGRFDGENFGVYLQGGHKFSKGNPGNGDNIDTSEEDDDTTILRIKGTHSGELKSLSFPIPNPLKVGPKKFESTFKYSLTGWWDAKNSATYHNASIAYQISIDMQKDKDGKVTKKSTRDFELKYENGSGAPNFNEGDQFSANLKIAF